MKKLLTLLLAVIIFISVVGCGSSTTVDNAPVADPVATDEELALAADLIKQAEDAIISASSHQLDGWTKYSDIMACYFVDSEYENLDTPTLKTRARNIHDLRVSSRSNLDEAKELMGTNGTSDYFNAVKEYYKNVNSFWNLISEFPEGYSQLTYSNTVAEYKANCESAYAELDFYS